MTSALYLEHYLDSLDNLPIELQRNFTLMRDLDSRAQELMKTIDKLGDDYLNNIKVFTTDKKKERMAEIQQLFSKAKEYGDDKVQLAIQTYELVDKHIRRLDSDLARFEAEIQEKAAATCKVQEEPPQPRRGRKKATDKDSKKKRIVSSDEEVTTKTGKRKQKKGTANKSGTVSSNKGAASKSNLSSMSGVTHSTDAIDMPVDPNEPTYCLCNQVSYGEMIGCDNPDCPIEWFHFACVKLTTKPKGKWFCPKCFSEKKKK